MPQVSSTSTPKFQGKLSRTMLLLIIPITIIPVLVVGGIAYFGAKDLLRSQSYAQLSTVGRNIESQINSWLGTKHVLLHNATTERNFSDTVETFLSMDKDDPDFDATGESILFELNQVNAQQPQPVFNYFVVVDQKGEILAAPIPNWEGEIIHDEQFFAKLETGAVQSKITFRLKPFQASDTIIITGAPILDNDVLEGAIIGITRDDDLREFLQTAHIFPSSQAYFVNANHKYLGITEILLKITRLEPSPEQKQILETGLIEGLENEEGYLEASYPSFRSELSLGTFTSLPKLNSGLVVEVPTAAVYSHLNSLLPLAGGLLIVLSIVLGLLIRFGANRIADPIIHVAETANRIASGDWQERVHVERGDEIGLLAYSFNTMTDQLVDFYRRMETKVQERTDQLYAISEIESEMSSASTVKELLNITTWRINDLFDFSHIAIYELNPSRQYAVLRRIAGERASQMLPDRYTLNISSHRLIQSAINSLQPATTSSGDETIQFGHDRLPETQAAAIFPILFQDEIYGFLSLQSQDPLAFNENTLAALRTIAEHLTVFLQHLRSQQVTETSLAETSHLYQAGQRISQAENWDEIEDIMVKAFENITHISGLFVTEGERFLVRSITDPEEKRIIPPMKWLPVSPQEMEASLPKTEPYLIITDLDNPKGIPSAILEIPKELNCQNLAIFPIREGQHLSALVLLGSREEGALDASTIQPFTNFLAMTNATLEKILAMRTINQQLTELQTIQEINQTISQEIDRNKIYLTFHDQIRKALGDIDFLITIYDKETESIRVPYMYEQGSGLTTIPPFPLGEGLTSIVLRTKKPLMLVENTEERVKALGAKTVGAPSKSWLGVPMLVQGEPIGTVTVQDLENEQAFNEGDMKLLSTLASQVGIAIRNTMYLEATQERSQRQEKLFEATTKLRSSTEMKTILATTATEIGKLFGAKSARIELSSQPESAETAGKEEAKI